MIDRRRRGSDGEDENHEPERTGDAMRVGWGSRFVEAKGNVVISALLALIVAVMVYYHGVLNAQEHKGIANELRIQTCVQSLTFDERKAMRERAATGRPIPSILRAWCPWMLEIDENSRP